ncbi:MAG: Holliday junction branch migration protein RuvA [Chlamydiia bacterium]|nr:Holliday junction branch migration protein RuvA [Chlamydiia bacterium]MCP5509548.1 Holliday junction branch migration protein RuvA [Chlamydiales bacterium]
MFAYIKGKLSELTPTKAIIEAGGIGYLICIPLNTYSELTGSLGQDILLYLSHIVREDSENLYGFHTKNERELFEKIGNVSGIGPKTALSIIGHMHPEALEWAIAKQDVAALSKIPGIGNKTAQRMILELQGKIMKKTLDSLPDTAATSISQDAISALMQLGYNLDKSQKAVSKALASTAETPDLSALISQALKIL